MQKTETESVKTEQPVKMNFFEALTGLISKNVELTKDVYIYKYYAQKFSDLIHNLVILGISYSEHKKYVPAQQSKF